MCDEYVDDLIATQKVLIETLQAEVRRLRDEDDRREREYKLKMGMLQAVQANMEHDAKLPEEEDEVPDS